MTNEQLTSLLRQLANELVSFHNDPDEVALSSSTFCSDEENFKAAVEEAINLWICKGMWPSDLATSRRFNIWIRFYLAFAVLSECNSAPTRRANRTLLPWHCTALAPALQVPLERVPGPTPNCPGDLSCLELYFIWVIWWVQNQTR
jgi:hypothetical protein